MNLRSLTGPVTFDLRRIGCICGIAATAGFLALYITAMIVNPNHRFGQDFLSDLGVDEKGGVRQNPWPFNLGCILAGTLAVPFAWLALRPALPPRRTSTAGVVVFSLASVFLILVGIFNENFKGIHGLVAAVFFLGMVIASLLFLKPTLEVPTLGKPIATISMVYVVLAVGFVATGSGLVEAAAVLTIVVWGFIVAVRLLLAPVTQPSVGADAQSSPASQ